MTGRAVEQRYLEILTAVSAAVAIPVAVKLGPHFSALGHMARELDRAGAAALVLFNRFYQPDVDLTRLLLTKDLELSSRHEIRLPLLWIGVLAGQVSASLAARRAVCRNHAPWSYVVAIGAGSPVSRSGPRQAQPPEDQGHRQL
jgi:dihydroorotate dehydrogenase (fumarate)